MRQLKCTENHLNTEALCLPFGYGGEQSSGTGWEGHLPHQGLRDHWGCSWGASGGVQGGPSHGGHRPLLPDAKIHIAGGRRRSGPSLAASRVGFGFSFFYFWNGWVGAAGGTCGYGAGSSHSEVWLGPCRCGQKGRHPSLQHTSTSGELNLLLDFAGSCPNWDLPVPGWRIEAGRCWDSKG